MKRAVTIRLAAAVVALLLILTGLWLIYSAPSSRQLSSKSTIMTETQPPASSTGAGASQSRPELPAPADKR